MHCLVEYVEDNVLYIVPTKKLIEIDKDVLYWAPYKGMGYYEAMPLCYENDRVFLENIKKEFQKLRRQDAKKEQLNTADIILDESYNSIDQTGQDPEKNRLLTAVISDVNNDLIGGSGQDTEKGLLSAAIISDVNNDSIGGSGQDVEKGRLSTACLIADGNNNFIEEEGQDEGKEMIHVDISDVNVNCIELTGPVVLTEVMKETTLSPKKKEKKPPSHKQHSCYFCKKVLYQIPRHWFTVHFKEVEIKDILSLHPDNPLRAKKIDDLRKKGDFEHNKLMSDENKIVTRISNIKSTKFVPCHTCLGYFSKENLRHHRKRCSPRKGDRSIQGNSRKLTNYIHEKASETLKGQIACAMFQDNVSNNFLYDEIIILYGNFLCIKYTDSHLKNHIRAQLRLLGRFMVQIKARDCSIKCCKDLMHPSHIDTIRGAIDDVAGLNKTSGIYEHPTNARTLKTEFKKILEVVLSECDKKEDDHLMKLTKALSRRCKLELDPYINRICKLSENKYKRLKGEIDLPENNEIEKYLSYLLEKVTLHYEELRKEYTFKDWNELCQSILVALIVFNRKRPGETQRIELDDFYQKESVKKKDMDVLSNEEKLQAHKYDRVAFRGKLGNSTALLIDKNSILPGLEIMIKHRSNAGVHPKNRFLFACPSKRDENKTYDAYRCHRQLLINSGLNFNSLTFTSLRKQFATQVARSDPSPEEELIVSNYMSHDYKIHKNIYDQSRSLTDITRISKHLEASARVKSNLKKQNYNKLTKTKKKKVHRANNRDIDATDDEYFPSSSEDESENKTEVDRILGKYKPRKIWSCEEKTVTRLYFKQELANKCSVGIDKIKEFKERYNKVLNARSVSMIKQWLDGEVSRIMLREEGIQEKRPRFSTPEKELLERSTEKYSAEGSEPSLQELEELIKTHDVLKRRSANSLKKKIQQMKKQKMD